MMKTNITEIFGSYNENITIAKREESGFSINYNNGKGVIEYGRECDLYRAYALLDGALKQGCDSFKLSEKPNFDKLGVMIDVSRGHCLKPETVKDIMRITAKMGYNRIMLYTEDTFLLEEYPYFGYMRGAYTEDELKDMVDYGENLGLECVPCIETLSHMEHILRWAGFGKVKNSQRTLLVGAEETYALIEEMIKVCRRCFKTDVINVGMDEADDLADGPYRKKNGLREKMDVFSEHLVKVTEICRKYNFKPMIWCDMYFVHCSSNGAYQNAETQFPESLINKIPEDVTMVYWDYSNNDAKRIENMLNATKRLERPVIYAAGIWTMNGFTPNLQMTYASGMTGVKGCIDAGVKDMFVTMWGDNGNECDIYATLLGLQMFAEGCYSENFTEETVNERFKLCTGYDAEAFEAIAVDKYPRNVVQYYNGTGSKFVIYSDILMGLFDVNFSKFDIKAHFDGYLKRIEALAPQKGLEYLFDYYTKHHRMLAKKCDMGIRLADAYKKSDRDALKAMIKEIEELQVLYKEFHEAYVKVWLRNNKPQGLEVIDFRLGGMESRIATARMRVEAFLAGEIESIPELEEERKPFAAPGRSPDFPLFSFFGSAQIFTASNL